MLAGVACASPAVTTQVTPTPTPTPVYVEVTATAVVPASTRVAITQATRTAEAKEYATARARRAQATVEAISAAITSYESLARTPERYKDKFVILLDARVLEVLDQGDGFYFMRVDVPDNSYGRGGVVGVMYSQSSSRLLEGDTVSVYGVGYGLVTYESVLGTSITIPMVLGTDIELH